MSQCGDLGSPNDAAGIPPNLHFKPSVLMRQALHSIAARPTYMQKAMASALDTQQNSPVGFRHMSKYLVGWADIYIYTYMCIYVYIYKYIYIYLSVYI